MVVFFILVGNIIDFLSYVLFVYSRYRIGNRNKFENEYSFIYIKKIVIK